MSSRYVGGIVTKNPQPLNPAAGNAADGVFTMDQYMQAVQGGTWPSIDPYFENTTLLLHGNGTNGAQNNTFLDSSTNNFTITRNGNTTQGTFTPFSKPDGRFGNFFVRSSSQYLTVSNAGGQFSFGTGAFTIECWVNLASMPSGTGYPASYWLFGGGPLNSNPGIEFYINNTQIGFNLTDFLSPTAIGNHGMSVGDWYHVAVIRGGGSNQTLSIYVNGTRVATASSVTATADAATSGIAISAAEPSGATGGNFDGYISNYRIVKGTAVYDPTQTTLTVPTAPLTAITNTSLLTCQSNRFIDNSSNNFTITPNGSVTVTPFSPFPITTAYDPAVNGGSGYFDGSGDYIQGPNNSAFAPGTGNFTIEAWVYPSTFSSYRSVFDTRDSVANNDGMVLGLANASNGTWGLYKGSAVTVVQSSTNLTLNNWQHIAAVRNGSTVTLYLNGVSVGSATDAQNFTDQDSNIGRTFDNYNWLGYISSLRFTKSAVYTSAFTPPTAPLTAISNTSLLLNFTNAGIIDNSMSNNLETVGNAQIDTTTKKYGTGSMDFDGDDYIRSGETSPEAGKFGIGQFTVECWLYPTSLSQGGSYGLIVGTIFPSSGWSIQLVHNTGVIRWDTYSVTVSSASNAISASIWQHIAVTRDSSNVLRIFVNGTQVASSTVTENYATSGWLGIGQSQNSIASDRYFRGYIDDLRITKGIARYTANFTPQTSQWQDQ